MNLKKSTTLIVLLSACLFSVCSIFSLYSMKLITDKSNQAVLESQKIEHMLVEAAKAQAEFQQQIREFKNILLRASNDDLYKKHLGLFKEKHDLVQLNLDSVSKSMVEAGMSNEDAEKLITDHSEIKFKFLEAAKSVRFVGISAAEAADQQSSNIDETAQNGLSEVRKRIDAFAVEKSEKRKNEIENLGSKLFLTL